MFALRKFLLFTSLSFILLLFLLPNTKHSITAQDILFTPTPQSSGGKIEFYSNEDELEHMIDFDGTNERPLRLHALQNYCWSPSYQQIAVIEDIEDSFYFIDPFGERTYLDLYPRFRPFDLPNW